MRRKLNFNTAAAAIAATYIKCFDNNTNIYLWIEKYMHENIFQCNWIFFAMRATIFTRNAIATIVLECKRISFFSLFLSLSRARAHAFAALFIKKAINSISCDFSWHLANGYH